MWSWHSDSNLVSYMTSWVEFQGGNILTWLLIHIENAFQHVYGKPFSENWWVSKKYGNWWTEHHVDKLFRMVFSSTSLRFHKLVESWKQNRFTLNSVSLPFLCCSHLFIHIINFSLIGLYLLFQSNPAKKHPCFWNWLGYWRNWEPPI